MWAYVLESGVLGVSEGVANGIPWSGNERNHLFFGGVKDAHFEDYSGISGIDDPGDGRGFSILDYDRDGRPDIALASPGKPRFRLLRNGIGDRVGKDNGFIALRLVGGNHEAVKSEQWSARDGYGAAISLDLGDTQVYREHQPESGYVGQNSATMIIGIGGRDKAKRLQVRWLSGKRQALDDVPGRKLITVYENPKQSPNGEAFVVEDYVKDTPRKLAPHLASPNYWKTRLLPKPPLKSKLELIYNGAPVASETGITLIATMATWCTACVEEMPEFNALRQAFSPEELTMRAVPVDAEDSAEMLAAWSGKHKPPYEIAAGIERSEVDRVNEVTLAELRTEAVPATFIVDASGQVLLARWGVPTISSIKKFLWQDQAKRALLVAERD